MCYLLVRLFYCLKCLSSLDFIFRIFSRFRVAVKTVNKYKDGIADDLAPGNDKPYDTAIAIQKENIYTKREIEGGGEL